MLRIAEDGQSFSGYWVESIFSTKRTFIYPPTFRLISACVYILGWRWPFLSRNHLPVTTAAKHTKKQIQLHLSIATPINCSLVQACGDRSGSWLGIRNRVVENFPRISELVPQSSRCVRFQGQGFLQTFSTFSLAQASFTLRLSAQAQEGEHGRMVLASGGDFGIGVTNAGCLFGWVGSTTVEVREGSMPGAGIGSLMIRSAWSSLLCVSLGLD